MSMKLKSIVFLSSTLFPTYPLGSYISTWKIVFLKGFLNCREISKRFSKHDEMRGSFVWLVFCTVNGQGKVVWLFLFIMWWSHDFKSQCSETFINICSSFSWLIVTRFTNSQFWITARPRGVRTSEIQGFELDSKTLEVHWISFRLLNWN